MAREKLETIYIPHLRGQFQQGAPVLFTGAGFSMAAKNISGSRVPGYRELTEAIWGICYPGEPFEKGTLLHDLFEDARIRHRTELTKILRDCLTVDGNSIPEWYSTYFSLPWLRCYTLNIDDLPQSAGRTFTLPRRPVSVSATSSRLAQVQNAGDEQLQVIHLNGTLEDVPDDVTFSMSQYGHRLANQDAWYLQLATDLMVRPVVFVGSRLEEPPLWQHLELRRARGGSRGQRELRPRSYLVSPSLPRAKRALLSEYNIVWLPMDAEEFSNEVLEPLRLEVIRGFDALRSQRFGTWGSAIRLAEVQELSRTPFHQTDYLLGHEPEWCDIQTNRAVERQIDETIANVVESLRQKRDCRGVLIITGTAGSGKSTSMMRACLRLSAAGIRVGWLDRNTQLAPREIIARMREEDGPEALAIDDADIYGSELAGVVREVATSDRAPLVIVEVRSGKVDTALSEIAVGSIPRQEITMPPLADVDIGSLIDVLDRENGLGVLKGKARKEQERAFREQAGRQMLVAMYQATSNRRFEEKAVDELAELRGETKLIYSLVATASALRFGLLRDEVVLAIGDRSNTTLNIVDQLLRRHLISLDRSEKFIVARHRVIASMILEALREKGELEDVVYGIILVGAAKTTQGTPRSARPSRLLRAFLNHDFLFRVLDVEAARNLYGLVEHVLSWEPQYWLQRGSLEVECGDVGLAENFLSQARSLAPDDPFVENEWGYLLFKKALAGPGSVTAPDLVEETTETLMALIGGRRSLGPHPYHVLGSQGLAWARRGIRDEDDRAKYLRRLIGVVGDGKKRFPQATDLEQLEQDLTRELLSLALPRFLRQ